MNTKRKSEFLKNEDARYDAFIKYLRKRMKELEKEEEKFRENVKKENVIKEKKFS